MFTGRQALSAIDRAILQTRTEETRLEAVLRSATDEAARLRTRQAENFKALAELKLDMLRREQVVGAIDAAERRALEILAEHQAAASEAAKRRADALAAATAAEAEHEKAAEAVEDAATRIEALSAAVSEELSTNTDWTAQDQRVREAVAKAEAAEGKAAQAEADRQAKGRPYDEDPLFSYLWKIGYGTSSYRGGPLARLLDGFVARVVGFAQSRPNYYMLNEIPVRLRDHAARLRSDIAVETEKRAAIERDALEAKGIVALEAALQTVEAARDKAAAALAEAKDALEALDGAGGPWGPTPAHDRYQDAVKVLSDSLARDNLRDLYREALATPSPEDERIVQALEADEKAVAEAEAQIDEIRRTAIDLAKKRSELEKSQAQARQSGYGDPAGEFINADVIGRVIGGILAGGLSSRNLDEALRDGYRRRRTTWNGDFGGGLRIPRGGGPWGGGGGSRTPSPPRSSGGGGFRTGGGF